MPSCPPTRPCSKAFLLRYESGLRVVVHTANMIYPDCNNKSQGVWWQDFPPKDDQSPQVLTTSFSWLAGSQRGSHVLAWAVTLLASKTCRMRFMVFPSKQHATGLHGPGSAVAG